MENDMTKHADERPGVSCGKLRALDGEHRRENIEKIESEKTLATYDATVFVGLRTIIYDAAIERIEDDGDVTIELPKLPKLLASAAVARCLMPIKLRGSEIKAMRRIMKMTLTELAERLDGRTAAETVSRWESEGQPMGGYAEKVFRLVVCEKLKGDAPGIDYNASMIAHLKVCDPWRVEEDYEVPAIGLWLGRLKDQCSGTIIDAWNEKKAA
jgi:DNA-binding transcriptional regulator YiaG